MTLLGMTAVICGLSFLTSWISGVLGMAGGMVLMGGLPLLMTSTQAICLHGVIQGFANLQRTVQLRSHLSSQGAQRAGGQSPLHSLLALYSLGAGAAYIVLNWIHVVPNLATLYLLLSAVALIGAADRVPSFMTFERGLGALSCGFLVSGIQFVAGVAGPLLDLFFRDRTIPKERVVAIKSVTQFFSHVLKVLLMTGFLREAHVGFPVTGWGLALILLSSFAGTALSKRTLLAMKQSRFYSLTSRVLGVLSFIYLVKAYLVLS